MNKAPIRSCCVRAEEPRPERPAAVPVTPLGSDHAALPDPRRSWKLAEPPQHAGSASSAAGGAGDFAEITEPGRRAT
jgi:hypothetical protein